MARVGMNPPVSQDDLSGKLAHLGVQMTQTAMSKLESGQRYVLDYEAMALARALKVRIGWLFGEEEVTHTGSTREH